VNQQPYVWLVVEYGAWMRFVAFVKSSLVVRTDDVSRRVALDARSFSFSSGVRKNGGR
jgi:hypothetical protein